MPTNTPNINLIKPDTGGSDYLWGASWNTNADTLDTAIHAKFDKTGGNIIENITVGSAVSVELGSGYANIQAAGSSGAIVQAQTASGGTKMAISADTSYGYVGTRTNQAVKIIVNSNVVGTLDAGGSLGLGVTPCGHVSAGYGGPMAQVGGRATILGSATTAAFCNNAYYASGYFRYISDGVATMLEQVAGEFRLHQAATGTAGQTISFVRPITLDINNNFLVGATTSSGFGGAHRISKDASSTEGNAVLAVDGGTGMTYSALYLSAGGGGWNSANAAVWLGKNSVTGRSINAGGTINASGADAAEYRKNNGLTIAKGQIVGYKNDGTLTLTWSEATMARVKSTDPHIVGGDNWGTEDKIGKRPDEPKFMPPEYTGRVKPADLAPEPQSPAQFALTAPVNPGDDAGAVAAAVYALALRDYTAAQQVHADSVNAHLSALAAWRAASAQHAQAVTAWTADQTAHTAAVLEARRVFDETTVPAYRAALAAFEERLETARRQVDRIAYCGIVPCNVTGATPGHYIVAAEGPNGTIIGRSVEAPQEAQWRWVVGRCLRVLPDGRAEIDVMLS